MYLVTSMLSHKAWTIYGGLLVADSEGLAWLADVVVKMSDMVSDTALQANIYIYISVPRPSVHLGLIKCKQGGDEVIKMLLKVIKRLEFVV